MASAGSKVDARGLEILLLGPLEARRDGHRLELGGSKQRTLLGALALDANKVISDDRLIDILWHEDPPGAVTDVLRVHVSKLRRAFEADTTAQCGDGHGPLVVRKSSGYTLLLPAEQTDIYRCRKLISDAHGASTGGKHRLAVRLLEQALALWRGPALAEFEGNAYFLPELQRIERLRLEVSEDRFDACQRIGLDADIVNDLEALAAEHPLRERLQGQLMLALYRCGRQSEASDVYHRTRLRLADELGMVPGPEMQAHLRHILKHDASLAGSSAGPARMHRSQKFATKRHNLPEQVSSFIGRERQVAELLELLRTNRLLTLVGVGGIGKTRLALRLATAALPDFPDGVWLVDLATVTDPSMIGQVVLSALGLRLQPDATSVGSLITLLHRRTLLLILDNCEHLLPATAEVAETLLLACPSASILSTSRERLGADGEQAWPVPPMSMPASRPLVDVTGLMAYEAIRLFVERARMVRPDFWLTEQNASVIVQLCAQLDGIPLALELAAPRVAALSVQQLLDRLEDRFRLLARRNGATSRHGTLEHTVDWSHTLLSEDERALFRRLSVFAGAFDLDAAEAVCSADRLPRARVVELLPRLVDKSLVVYEDNAAGEGQYRLLETLRHYAWRKLSDDPEGRSVRELHALYFLSVGEGCDAQYRNGSVAAAVRRYESNHDNALAALEWSSQEAPELHLALTAAWWLHWWLQGMYTKGRERLAHALQMSAGDAKLRAHALEGIGRLLAFEGDLPAAEASFAEALEHAREIGDEFRIATILNALGVVRLLSSSYADAETFLRECTDVARRAGLWPIVAMALNNLGECAFAAGNYTAARGLYGESIVVARDCSLVVVQLSFATLERHTGRYTRARALASDGLQMAHELGVPFLIAAGVEAFAFLAGAQNQATRAATLKAAAANLYSRCGGVPDAILHRQLAEDLLRKTCDQLDDAALALASRAGEELDVDAAVSYALAG